MNTLTYSSMVHILQMGGIGSVFGLMTSLLTILLVRMSANRARQYKLNYVPITLVESKLRIQTLIIYPIVFAFFFVIVYCLGFIH